MKLSNILVLFFLTLSISLKAQVNGYVNVIVSDVNISKYAASDVISWNKSDSYTEEVGSPKLPVLVESFVVPLDAQVTEVKVSSVSKQKLSGNYSVSLVETPISIGIQGIGLNEVPAYNRNSPYPLLRAEIISDEYEHGYHVVSVRFYPFEYTASSGEINLCNFSYSIMYERGKSEYMPPLKQSSYRAGLAKKFIQSKVSNVSDIDAFSNRAVPTVNAESVNLNSFDETTDSRQRSVKVKEELIPEYFIITNNSMQPIFQLLASWKTKKGIPAIVKTTEEIDTEYAGVDLAEKIRNYLKECRHRWGDDFFVLLGGDTDIVPARMATNGPDRRDTYDEKTKIYTKDSINTPQDLYYTALDGTWNGNCNHIFNQYFQYQKENGYPSTLINMDNASFGRNLYLGRAPVRNRAEALNFVTKVMTYEKANADIDYSYLINSMAADGFIGKDESTGNLSFGAMSSLDLYYKNNAPILKRWLIADHFNCSCSKHGNQLTSSPGEELNKANFMSALQNGGNSGLNYFHIVYHMDHSIATSMGTSSLDKGESINNSDVDGLSNGKYYQIIFSSGCNPATYTKDCIAEHFINNRHGGAVAFIGNADRGWSGEYTQFGRFLSSLYAKSAARFDLGYAYQMAVGNRNSSNCRLHLLGDPEMPVWTDVPKDLQVEVSSSVITNGRNSITVSINNLPAGREAMICLMKGDEGYARKTVTAADPSAIFSFIPGSSGELDVTVTAHNFRPYETKIPVVVEGTPALKITDVILDDDYQGDSRGNGDGQPDAGERIELTLKLKNTGSEDAHLITGRLYCNSPYIKILYSEADFDLVKAQETVEAKFIFNIDSKTPEILKNDFNAIRFQLYLTDGSETVYADTFRISVHTDQLELRGLEGSSVRYNEFLLKVNLMNTGKASAYGVTATLSSAEGMIDVTQGTITYPVIGPNETKPGNSSFSFTVAKNFRPAEDTRLTLTVTDGNGKTFNFTLHPWEEFNKVSQSDLKYASYENAIDIYWTPLKNVSGYDIYRSSDGENGTYVKQNSFPLTAAYFKDIHVTRLATYHYKVVALSLHGNQTPLSGAIKAWTTWPLIDLFPRFSATSKNITGSVNVADVNYDGKKEIFLTEQLYDKDDSGYLLGMRHDGEELFDIDGNVTSFSGFAKLSTTARATPAIGDLKGDGEQNVITTTWNQSKSCKYCNAVECFASRDNNGDRLPDRLWKFATDTLQSYRGVVLSNLDNSGDGTMEVLFRSINSREPISMIDCNGNLKLRIPVESANYTMTAVADLDNDGDKEILAVAGSSLYIWHHNGTPFRSNPFFTCDQNLSSPVICDLNNDGKKEILMAGKETKESKIFAIDTNGKCLRGWDGTSAVTRIAYTNNSLDHALSVGDINRDGKLEVVTLGRDVVKAWKSDGTLLFQRSIPGLFRDEKYAANYSAAILADVDGRADNSMPDLIFPVGTDIYALHNDGSDVIGFPIQTDNETIGSVSVADLDGDGLNELVVVDGGQTYAWKTDGNPKFIEWGSERHDQWNTGEYAPICEPLLIRFNQTWDGVTPCGNVIVQSGKFTVPSGKNLILEKTSKIIVRPGAMLEVDGGTISNAYILALPGSNVTVKNNGAINLRIGAYLDIRKEAVFDFQKGSVD